MGLPSVFFRTPEVYDFQTCGDWEALKFAYNTTRFYNQKLENRVAFVSWYMTITSEIHVDHFYDSVVGRGKTVRIISKTSTNMCRGQSCAIQKSKW